MQPRAGHHSGITLGSNRYLRLGDPIMVMEKWISTEILLNQFILLNQYSQYILLTQDFQRRLKLASYKKNES